MQLGWSVKWPDGLEENYSFDSLIEWAKSYPEEFDYDAGMLGQIRDSNEKLRDFISPSMLGSCPRQVALMRLTDFYAPLYTQWAAFRGTIAHLIMERGWNEPDALLEQQIAVLVDLGDLGVRELRGTPDKVIPLPDGTWILADYKSTDDIKRKPKDSWVPQLSCYVWMLGQLGKPVSRAFIQEISMKTPYRLELELWSEQETREYVVSRMRLHAPTMAGAIALETLPPMLDPVLDEHQTWLCYSDYCPVRRACWKLHEEGK